jgi:hypothetical protein
MKKGKKKFDVKARTTVAPLVKKKMIAREKDSGYGWKFEDFEFRAAFHRLLWTEQANSELSATADMPNLLSCQTLNLILSFKNIISF